MHKIHMAGISTLIGLLAILLAGQPLTAGETKRVNTAADNIAIEGYDTVAYFTNGRPMKGDPGLTYSWNGAKWQFAEPAHRDMFAEDPERYAPQFGGFCSMALARGRIAGVDPEVWTIVDGKLYLNFNTSVGEKFRENLQENIEKANENWRKVK
ncbi:MAG: YHS domain-containing (seleno)protein [Rhodothermales bacterium]|nr:YHS domain-containing (seleno)protein [Rhodothermales bacterium]